MGRLDLVAAAGIGMDEVEELLDREVQNIKEEKERAERDVEEQSIAKEEEQYVTFALRNRQTNEQAFNMVPIQNEKVVTKEETKKTIEKQSSFNKQASKENKP